MPDRSNPRSSQPDWRALGDGQLHRLRQGREFVGDVRLQIRDARLAAAELGRHVIIARDDLGSASYLWVQFADGEISDGEPCPHCDGRVMLRQAPSVVVCERCGRVYELRAAALLEPDRGDDDADDGPEEPGTFRVAIQAMRRNQMSEMVTSEGRDLLRDEPFSAVLARVLGARATRVDLGRLWTLWEAAGLGAATSGGALAVGSTWAGGAAFLCLAQAVRTGESRIAIVLDHPRYQAHAGLLEEGQLETILDLFDELGAIVIADRVSGAMESLGRHRFGVVHLDLADEREIAESLELLHDTVVPGGVVVVDDYRIPFADTGRDGAVARGVGTFLASHSEYVRWRTPTRQAVLIKRDV